MVSFIRLSRSQHPPLKVTLSAIELLGRILANPIHDKGIDTQKAKKKLQNTMTEFGLVKVVFTLLCDSSLKIQIFKALMNLCIELLDGGNPMVQTQIFLYFNNPNSEVFFERIHQMFTDCIEKFANGMNFLVKRTKVFKKTQEDILCSLRLLQLFCENHDLNLQNYVRVQNKSRNSYNIIDDTMCLLEILIEKKVFSSFSMFSQCFDTLTEFVQGPCAQNQEFIADSKFLELSCILLSLDEKSHSAEVYN